MGTSTTPVFTMFPDKDISFVPLLPFVPMLAYQSDPILIIRGTLAQVSTLFRLLGLSQIPQTEVRMYLGLGSGLFPSIDFINALDSPETNIPTSRCTSTVKSKPEPRIFLPKR